MNFKRPLLAIFAISLALTPAVYLNDARASAQEAKPAAAPAKRPIELPDILKWKRLQSAVPSSDGQYFGYKVVPTEGDSEVVVRRVKDGKEWRFPAGENAAPGGGGPGGPVAAPRELSFSDDSKWFAFTITPGFKEAKRLRKERKPLQNKVVLLNLETEKKTEFEKIRRFAFLERSPHGSHSIVMVRMPPVDRPALLAPHQPLQLLALRRLPSGPRGRTSFSYELATGNELNFGNASDFSFSKNGESLVWIIDAQDKIGNGVQMRNMTTGAVMPLDSDKASYRGLTWTEKYDALTTVKGFEDKAWEDKLYSVVAFTGLNSGSVQKTVFNPKSDSTFPAGMTVSPNRNPTFNEDLTAITFGIHEVKRKKSDRDGGDKPAEAGAAGAPATARRPDDEPETPALVLWHWQDKRLQAQQQVEESRDKNYSYLSVYQIPEKKFIRIADDSLRQVTTSTKRPLAVGFDDRDYELLSNLDGRRYQDVYVVDLKTGTRKQALKKSRWSYGMSPDGSQFLYYDDGHYFAYDLASGQSMNITAKVPAVFFNDEDDHNVVKPPRFPMGWTKDSASVLLSDGWDIWNVPTRGGQAVNLTVNGKKDGIRYQRRFQIDPDEKGVDLSAPVYLTVYGEWTKKAGIARLDGGKPGPKVLLWDDAGFGGLLKSKKAEAYFYTRDTYQDSPEYYLADALLSGGKQLTTTNPQQKDFLWSDGQKLIDYTSTKGDKLQGALFLPANYQPGKSYPTVVYIYEKLSDGLNRYVQPSANGFNKSYYTSQGYAVLMPDITYRVNDPGMSAVWCVIPALEACDQDRHCRSWECCDPWSFVGWISDCVPDHSDHSVQGGNCRCGADGYDQYVQPDLLEFRKRLTWRSSRAARGRFTTSPADNVEAYIRNSPVFHAKNVKTPLLLLHNDKDGAVDFTQGIEYFSTLRRMQKPVVMLQYKGENHGLAVPANRKDYTVRFKEFVDYHLKGQPCSQMADRWSSPSEVEGSSRRAKQREDRESFAHRRTSKLAAYCGSEQTQDEESANDHLDPGACASECLS
jgi:dipeptidyl aminopeptidase/acylaminoacyl peptidase